MSTIRIGVIGCANIAFKAMIPAINSLNDKFKLVGVASRYKSKAKDFALRFNTSAFYNYEHLINSKECDAVYIPLPTKLNGVYAELALDNKLHVLVEKTMSDEIDVVNNLNEIAKTYDLSLVENFQFRFHNQMKDIYKILQSDEIGEIRCIKSSFGFPPFKDTKNIRYSSSLGGGALHDVGCYTIKLAQILLGTDISVAASSLFYDDNIDLWGGGLLVCDATKRFAQISFGFDNHYQCNLELWGSKGKLISNRIFTAPPEMNPEIIIEKSSGIKKFKSKKCNHYKNILNHFHKSISNKKIREKEYLENKNQARLVNEIKRKA